MGLTPNGSFRCRCAATARMPATEKSVMCRAAMSMLSGVGLKANPETFGNRILPDPDNRLCQDAPHAAEDSGIGGVAFHQLRNHPTEELQPWSCRLLDQRSIAGVGWSISR